VFIALEVHLLTLKIVQVPSPIVLIAMAGFVKIVIISIWVVVAIAIAIALQQILVDQLKRKCLGCLGQGLYLLGQRFVTTSFSFLFLLQMNLQLCQLLHSLIQHHLKILT
jgi:hypothetical protein